MPRLEGGKDEQAEHRICRVKLLCIMLQWWTCVITHLSKPIEYIPRINANVNYGASLIVANYHCGGGCRKWKKLCVWAGSWRKQTRTLYFLLNFAMNLTNCHSSIIAISLGLFFTELFLCSLYKQKITKSDLLIYFQSVENLKDNECKTICHLHITQIQRYSYFQFINEMPLVSLLSQCYIAIYPVSQKEIHHLVFMSFPFYWQNRRV